MIQTKIAESQSEYEIKKLFLTESGYPFIITGSGTVAMEAAVLSLLEPNDNGLILDTGYFAHCLTTSTRVAACIYPITLGRCLDLLKALAATRYLPRSPDTNLTYLNQVWP